jgi:hypothetical protein
MASEIDRRLLPSAAEGAGFAGLLAAAALAGLYAAAPRLAEPYRTYAGADEPLALAGHAVALALIVMAGGCTALAVARGREASGAPGTWAAVAVAQARYRAGSGDRAAQRAVRTGMAREIGETIDRRWAVWFYGPGLVPLALGGAAGVRAAVQDGPGDLVALAWPAFAGAAETVLVLLLAAAVRGLWGRVLRRWRDGQALGAPPPRPGDALSLLYEVPPLPLPGDGR